MAQALGGRYGLPHGAMNAVCLPGALRFNAPVVADALERLGEAMGHGEPIARVETLAGLGGFGGLREFGVPEDELRSVAEAAAARSGARANPRPAPPEAIEEILRGLWSRNEPGRRPRLSRDGGGPRQRAGVTQRSRRSRLSRDREAAEGRGHARVADLQTAVARSIRLC